MKKLSNFAGLAVAATTAAAVTVMAAACQNLGASKPGQAVPGAIPDKVSYNWDVRPILSQNCFVCHGNDAGARKAGLRLDVAADAYGKLPQDPDKRAVVRGDPRHSELIRRITAADPDERMPPMSTHKVLSARDVAVLTKWIKQGAKYEQHWAYIPPKAVNPGRSPWEKQAVNAIDRHVYANLQAKGLQPSPETDRETLINRVALDLTGLPPTLAQVDAFVADKSPDAYERVVDGLLASRGYAERQANVWLDVARYADTDGYLDDQYGRFQYPYRDWVVSAFQRNLPYDQFVTWQIAGDLLPNSTREQILATAFLRAGKKSTENGLINEEYRVEYRNERTELVGKAFLGLTVGCAKCHDHKYDAISQADYYSLGGFFNSANEAGMWGRPRSPMGPYLPWPSPMQSKALDAAQKTTAAKWAEYQAALMRARAAAAGQGAALAKAPQAQVRATLAGLITQSQQAYYPFDSLYKASLQPLTRAGRAALYPSTGKDEPAQGGKPPPPRLVKVSARTGPGDLQRTVVPELDRALALAIASGEMPKEPKTPYKSSELVTGFSPATLWTADSAGGGPAALNHVALIDGPPGHGKAVLIEDSTGMIDPHVGQFERDQAFSFDLWVKLPKAQVYEDVDIVRNENNRGPGYLIGLAANRLQFTLKSVPPYEMVSVQSVDALPTGRWLHITQTYDGSSHAAGVKLYLDGKELPTRVVNDRLTLSAVPNKVGFGTYSSYLGLSFGKAFQKLEFKGGALDELRVFTRALTATEVALLNAPSVISPDAAQGAIVEAMAQADPQAAMALAAWQQSLRAQQTIAQSVPKIPVFADAMTPRPTYLLERGIYDRHGEVVPVQALPRVFNWNNKLPPNRIGLSQWMFDRKNPLTARVYVNRLWQGHFGTGLVDTVDDFGTQGSNPSNPALLDYLAIEFQRSGWDIRHMHKLIVMSATYRQSSMTTPELRQKDPRNTTLARGPRFRLPAETIRDSALFASGLLVDKPGGDSVFPYQPEGVFLGSGSSEAVHPKADQVPADQMHRRSMYSFYKRNAAPPSLAVFDLADRNNAAVIRKISNTPLQALVLLNDPQYSEAYRKLAERVLKTTPDRDRQLVTLFRLATRRHPSPGELNRIRQFRDAQAAHFAASPAEAAQLLAVGVAPLDPAVDRVQTAALTMTAGAVMSSSDAYSLR